jgi:predicted MFS family arabinose efflux permease
MVSLWLARRYVPVSAPGGVEASREGNLDWRGLLLAAAGTLCLLTGMVSLHGGTWLEAVALLGAAAALLLIFVLWQRRMVRLEREPLMNLALFASRPFAMGSMVAFIYGTALFGSTYLLPVYMQLALGLSASHVGTILLPAGAVLALTIALVGRLADRQPTYRLVTLGLALLAASFALMLTIGLATALGWLVLWAVLGRIGLGFILPSLNLGSLRPLPQKLLSQGASAINFLRMLGGAIGVSLCGVVLEWRLAAHGDTLVRAATSPARLAAFNEAFLMLTGFCLLAMLAAWRMRTDAALFARPPG